MQKALSGLCITSCNAIWVDRQKNDVSGIFFPSFINFDSMLLLIFLSFLVLECRDTRVPQLSKFFMRHFPCQEVYPWYGIKLRYVLIGIYITPNAENKKSGLEAYYGKKLQAPPKKVGLVFFATNVANFFYLACN